MGKFRLAPRPTFPPPPDPDTAKPRRGPVLLLALGIPALLATAGEGAIAQTTKASNAPARSRANARPAAVKIAGGPGADAGVSSAPAPVPATSALPADAGTVETRVLDGGTRVFKFSELDIEGRLKSPQLVYFLRRVRAEFATGDLGHRTFLREMSETRKEPGF